MRIPGWMIFLGAIAFICVTAGITLVVVSSRSLHVLVREDYYREGLELDTHRAREAALDSLGVNLALRSEGSLLELDATYPEIGSVASVHPDLARLSLVVYLTRPDDASADFDAHLKLASRSPLQWVGHYDLRKGHWDARLVFSDSTGPRYERTLTLNRVP